MSGKPDLEENDWKVVVDEWNEKSGKIFDNNGIGRLYTKEDLEAQVKARLQNNAGTQDQAAA